MIHNIARPLATLNERNKNQMYLKRNEASSQDRGISRYVLLPHITKRIKINF